RESHGPYTSLKDLCMRLSSDSLNKKTIEALIKSGALDSVEGTRLQKMHVHMQIIDAVKAEKKTRMSGQMSLFDMMDTEERDELGIKYPDVGEYTKKELLDFEREMIGFYVSGHPLDEDMAYLKRNVTRYAVDFRLPESEGDDIGETIAAEPAAKDGEQAVIAGIVNKVTVKNTRNGAVMSFVTIEDMTGEVEVIVFPREHERYRSILKDDTKLMIRGKVTHENDRDAKLIASDITCFDVRPKTLWIRFETIDDYRAHESELLGIIDGYDGQDMVTIYVEEGKKMKQLPGSHSTDASEELADRLRSLYGERSVVIE
ncbi:MAG: DNA polymerase III subunit alpha, partial [Eubacterium sp.]|nr:DNA polymerase III subunit alpha [Eubacterium sp.]